MKKVLDLGVFVTLFGTFSYSVYIAFEKLFSEKKIVILGTAIKYTVIINRIWQKF